MWVYVGYVHGLGSVYYDPKRDVVKVQRYGGYLGGGRIRWRYEYRGEGSRLLEELGLKERLEQRLGVEPSTRPREVKLKWPEVNVLAEKLARILGFSVDLAKLALKNEWLGRRLRVPTGLRPLYVDAVRRIEALASRGVRELIDEHGLTDREVAVLKRKPLSSIRASYRASKRAYEARKAGG